MPFPGGRINYWRLVVSLIRCNYGRPCNRICYAGRACVAADGRPTDSERLVVNRCPWLLDFWASRYPDAQFLLFFTRAETALAQALMCGIEPFQFIKDWEVNTRHLIRFQRRYRQRALLLSAEAANENPHTLVEATRIIGLGLNISTGSVRGQCLQPAKRSVFWRGV
jgi:hypothetical protein